MSEASEPILVEITLPPPSTRRGNSWAKTVLSVDMAGQTARIFRGDFLRRGEPNKVAAGVAILLFDEEGSRDRPRPHARLVEVDAAGFLRPTGLEAYGFGWQVSLRDRVADFIDQPNDGPDPQEEAAVALLRSRGYTVLPPG